MGRKRRSRRAEVEGGGAESEMWARTSATEDGGATMAGGSGGGRGTLARFPSPRRRLFDLIPFFFLRSLAFREKLGKLLAAGFSNCTAMQSCGGEKQFPSRTFF